MKFLKPFKIFGALSIAFYGLAGCGGGSSPTGAAATVPGGCVAGQVYSTQYGCVSQAGCPAGMGMIPGQNQCVSVQNTVMSNCQVGANGAPAVYTAQYGCLPQGNCPYGQGSVVINNVNQCVPAQSGAMNMAATGCPVISSNPPIYQVMTSKGCLPQVGCPEGTGYLGGRCVE